MRYYTSLLLILILYFGCTNKKTPSPEAAVRQFYKGFTTGNFNAIDAVLSDTVKTKEGDYLNSYSKTDFYSLFQWDSVFKTSYEIKDLQNIENEIVVTIASRSLRYEFLKNNPLVYKRKFSFKADKIAFTETLNYLDTDWKVWENRRDSLVVWIKAKHPEIDSFIYDLSKNGAINYLNAIELYNTEVLH